MKTFRIIAASLILLTCGPCAVHGQSIVVSGQKRSIVVSGRGHAPAPVSQPVIANPSSVVASNAPTNAPVDAGAAGEVLDQHPGYYVVMYTAGYCPPCREWKRAGGLERMRELGYPVTVIDVEANPQFRRSIPCFEIVDRGTGAVVWTKTGSIPPEAIVANVPAKSLTAVTRTVNDTSAGLFIKTADQPSNYTEAQRQKDIEHLLTHRSHAGKFTREYLESLSGYELIDLHNTDHGVPTVKGQKVGRTVAQPATRQRLPVVNTQWGTIDLETYNRPRCNCPMCQGIRALQQQYRQTSLERPLPAAQEPTPDDVLPQVIDALQLTPQDKLADIGCGDGRILIAAVERYGCNGIGIEIDPARAELARQNVERAGLSTRIEIVTGDALRFWPADHGVTAAVAYLYPDLLSQLRPQLEQVRVLVTPFHQVPGLAMVQRGDVWVRRTKGQG